MIESVLNQTYGKLELCLADGSGEDDTAGTVICEYVEKDPRVRYQKLGSNLGIAGNTNAAVNMAEGSMWHFLIVMICWKSTHCLKLSNGFRTIRRLIWSTPMRDKVTFDSKTYFKPHFKPVSTGELLRSNNYICHLLTVKKDLLMEAGLYKEEFDGAQDYDLILRCSEKARNKSDTFRRYSITGEVIQHRPQLILEANHMLMKLVEKLWEAHLETNGRGCSCRTHGQSGILQGELSGTG